MKKFRITTFKQSFGYFMMVFYDFMMLVFNATSLMSHPKLILNPP